MCGKYTRNSKYYSETRGSPPRVREVSPVNISLNALCGITPACAGSIAQGYQKATKAGDHPRVCGKYHFQGSTFITNMGSPPRVREVYHIQNFRKFWQGITPACAGSILKKVNIYAISSIAFSKILLLSLLACSVHSNMLVLFYPLYIQSHIL